MKTLVIDAGNSNIKAGLFSENAMQEIFVFERNQVPALQNIFHKYSPTKILLCNVGDELLGFEELIPETVKFNVLSYKTKLPFTVKYNTPQTLGMDRVAAVAGALHFFPGANCLIIDAGTCITYDFVTKDGNYLGGAISPGLQMRLNAMHHFTSKLPRLEFTEVDDFIGNTTETSLLSGAFYGLAGEINETISRYEGRYGDVQVLLCGGNSALFDKHIKRDIFATPFLVLYGLNKILSFNAE